jgi:hypothetical protein
VMSFRLTDGRLAAATDPTGTAFNLSSLEG